MARPTGFSRRFGATALVGFAAALECGVGTCWFARAARADPAPAAGMPSRVSLRWSAPEGCPDAEQVTDDVDRILGASQVHNGKRVEASATVSRDDRGGWLLRIETPGEGVRRVREIRGDSCTAVAEATALVLALMVDPAAVVLAAPLTTASASPPAPRGTDVPPALLAPPAPAPPPARTSERAPAIFPPVSLPPPASAPPPVRAAPRPTAPKARPPSSPALPLSLRIVGWIGVDAGSLPEVAAGFGAATALLYGAQRFELSAGFWPGRAARIPPRLAGGTVDLFVMGLATCRAWLVERLEIGPCVGLELGRLHAQGFGVTDPGEAAELWAAIKAGGGLGFRASRAIALSFRIDAGLPLARPTFVLEGVGPVHRSAPVIGRTAVGIEVRY